MNDSLQELRRAANRNLVRLASGEVAIQQEAEAERRRRQREAEMQRVRDRAADRLTWRREMQQVQARLAEIEEQWEELEAMDKEFPGVLEEVDAERDTLWERQNVLERKLGY
jgi:chromosome segregation ATPase